MTEQQAQLAKKHLQALDLKSGASYSAVKQKYRLLSRVWHPDRFKGQDELVQEALLKQRQLNAAYEWLTKNQNILGSPENFEKEYRHTDRVPVQRGQAKKASQNQENHSQITSDSKPSQAPLIGVVIVLLSLMMVATWKYLEPTERLPLEDTPSPYTEQFSAPVPILPEEEWDAAIDLLLSGDPRQQTEQEAVTEKQSGVKQPLQVKDVFEGLSDWEADWVKKRCKFHRDPAQVRIWGMQEYHNCISDNVWRINESPSPDTTGIPADVVRYAEDRCTLKLITGLADYYDCKRLYLKLQGFKR